MKTNTVAEQFFGERGIKESTQRLYLVAFNHYQEFTGLSLQELLDEAEEEEEERIRWKKRMLKQRLINWRTHCFKTYSENSAKQYFNLIKHFYTHFEIEIGALPYFNPKNVIRYDDYKHSDLPTKEELKMAYDVADNIMRAVLLFISSSGCGRTETCNLTIQDFVDATNEFTDETDLEQRWKALRRMKDIIPIFHVLRQKTQKEYDTFCSTEAVHEICNYLLSRKDKYTLDSQLFKISPTYLNMKFRDVNDKMQMGSARAYRRLRPHALRKFHASTLMNSKNALTLDEIDSLQGRSKDSIQRSYFFDDTVKLREKYRLCIDDLNIISESSPSDYEKVKSEKEMLQAKINEQDKKISLLVEEMKKLQELLS